MSHRSTAITALVLLAFAAIAAPAAADQELADKVRSATQIFGELSDLPDRAVPEWLERDAKCIAVIPHIVKGAFWVGGRYGRGIISCRDDAGKWSPPAFLSLWGGSFGFQIGGEVTDLVLYFMTRRGAEALLKTKFTLGGDASVAAGPAGRTAQAATDVTFKAEIYAYAKSRGLFAGISFQGARIDVNQKAIARFYGRRLWPEDILFAHQVPTLPPEAEGFMAALPAASAPEMPLPVEAEAAEPSSDVEDIQSEDLDGGRAGGPGD